MTESGAVRDGELLLLDEQEPRFQTLHVHGRVGAGEDARLAVRERDLREVVFVGEQSDGEGVALVFRQSRPADFELFRYAFESVDDVASGQWGESGGVAGQVFGHAVGGGCAVGLCRGGCCDGVVDDGSHLLHGLLDAVEHVPVVVRLVCRGRCWCVVGHVCHSFNSVRHAFDGAAVRMMT